MSIRVLVVDDSAIARKVIKDELSKDPDIQVVGVAGDPFDASEKIEQHNPDVMTLDLEMPRMDGITFLRSLMRHHPIPVIVVSAYTTKGSRLAVDALEAGAVDIVPKPGSGFDVRSMSGELIAKVKAASQARLGQGGQKTAPQKTAFSREISEIGHQKPTPASQSTPQRITRRFAPEDVPVLPRLTHPPTPEQVIVIGSSTGGTQALQYILTRLPDNMPPILITQHMPPGFTKAFADRLNTLCQMSVKEGENHDKVEIGNAYIAPGGMHMVLNRTGGRYWVGITDGPRVCRQRPSVEVLFQSAAKNSHRHTVGVILTGMGNDGAVAMKQMKDAGALNIAEDEKSCVVFGMPKEAIKEGGV
ncbi:MAG: chemotaxis response regulator protein-glutamate methylesterase, partial [Deltaproteobacteria bacterium]|nr:chemotaxis response regulator protein-glutamate methylesterase [Deltaproteobacteria bacterium]